MNKIKNYCTTLKMFIINKKHYLYTAIPFLLMDIIVRLAGYKLSFPVYHINPNLFTICWIILFVGIITSLKGVWSKVIYWILFSLFLVASVTQLIYLGLTNYYFGFNLMLLADEGSSYIWDTMINANIFIYIGAALLIALSVIISKKIPRNEKTNWRGILITIVVFILFHILSVNALGPANSELKWNSFNKPRNIYNEYSDSNKSIKISGLYEYTFRNFYFTFMKSDEDINNEDATYLNTIYSTPTASKENNYTGIFEGKNVIFLQLEGIDDWVFTKKDMPNLYSLLENSINFTDHYSTYTGGGSTFNSEFSVNTGFTTPVSYISNVYTLNTNTFNNTLPQLFKERGYSVNAFHMNSSEFYSRGVNYKSWGYDNYYGLTDVTKYEDDSYTLDRELILNEVFYEKMFKQDGPFLNYIITYTPHTPFTTDSDMCRLLAIEKYGEDNIPVLTEEECVRMAVGETDKMVGLLIQALKDNGLYDNTVIVVYADHYLYTIEDKTILEKYKDTSTNLVNHTPFFIWSSDLEKTEVTDATMQLNILPTVLNLFGIEYNTNEYIGKDALANDYEDIIFFNDHSWYNGSVYVDGDKIIKGPSLSAEEIQISGEKVANLIKQNDLTLKYDYFSVR